MNRDEKQQGRRQETDQVANENFLMIPFSTMVRFVKALWVCAKYRRKPQGPLTA